MNPRRVFAVMGSRLSCPLLLLLLLAAAACGGDTTGPAAPDTRFVAVAAGDAFACGLVKDGRVFCWGSGESGQLGGGTFAASAVPTAVPSDRRFTALTARGVSVCALDEAGAAWCWGGNANGQLGVPQESCHPVLLAVMCEALPAKVTGAPALSAPSMSHRATCALSGTDVWCWGQDLRQAAPVDPLARMADTASYAAVAAGDYHACGITVQGALRCWGSGWSGQLGIGDSVMFAAAPVAGAPGMRWRVIAAAAAHTCGVDTAGVAFCWGQALWGALGLDTTGRSNIPRAVSDSLHFQDISTGANHTCAVSTGGDIYCWGLDSTSALGQVLGSPTCSEYDGYYIAACRRTPTPVQNGPSGAVRVSVGDWHTCAVTATGEAWCWGRGIAGQLGRGTFGSSSVPERVVIPEATP